MTANMTNYYEYNLHDPFRISQSTINERGRPKILGPKVSQKLDALILIGFADAALGNQNYQALLDNLEINNMTNQELFEAITETPIQNTNDSIMEVERSLDDQYHKQVSPDVAAQILNLRLRHDWSTKSILAKFHLSKSELNEIFKQV